MRLLKLALLAAAMALEEAFAGDPTLARPKPDLAALRSPRLELRAIVTHPPGGQVADAADGSLSAV